jgi:hypothetical protein
MLFRTYLVVAWLALAIFTGVVMANHGTGLLPIFFADIAAAGWPGQFNADFMTMLALSGLWCAWRGNWSIPAIGHGILAFIGGGIVLMATLLLLHLRYQGDMRRVLLGDRAR